MYKNITITGFSDEISTSTTEQFEHLNHLGIKYFDPRGVDGVNISNLTDEQADALKNKMDLYGIKAACIGSPIGKIQITDDFGAHLEKLRKTIRIAKKLGTKYIRIFSFYIPDGEFGKYRDEVMLRMSKMAEIAEGEGVVLLHENEKDVYGDVATRCKDIFDTVNSPALGCIFDPANFVQCGQSVYPESFEILKPYIKYLHIKDAKTDATVVPAGKGDGCIKEVIENLLKDGFTGFACLEPHLGSFEGLAALELEDTMLKLEKSDSSKFTLAYNSLCEILDALDA